MPPSTRKTPRRTTTRRDAAPTTVPQPPDPNSKYAPTSWGNGGTGGMEDLTVPSGQTCLCRRPGVEGLMKAGVLRDVDSLTALVNEKHIKRVNGKPTGEIDPASLLSDPEALENVVYAVDKVVCFAVVQPQVHMTPSDVTRREPGVIYADMVDLMDKMFIFNFVVGGTRDLETFRREFSESVGGLEAGQGVPGETE